MSTNGSNQIVFLSILYILAKKNPLNYACGTFEQRHRGLVVSLSGFEPETSAVWRWNSSN